MELLPKPIRRESPARRRRGSRAPPSTAASSRSFSLSNGSCANVSTGSPHTLSRWEAAAIAARNGRICGELSPQIASWARNSTLNITPGTTAIDSGSSSVSRPEPHVSTRSTQNRARTAPLCRRRLPSARRSAACGRLSSTPTRPSKSSIRQQNSGFPASSATARWRSRISFPL